MATKGAIAARQAVAYDRLGAALARLAEREGVEVPDAQPFPYRQPELRAAAKMEHYAKVVEAILGDEPKAAERPADDGQQDGGDEPTFAGQPLSWYEGKSDEEILDSPDVRVGEATLKKIRKAQAKRDTAK